MNRAPGFLAFFLNQLILCFVPLTTHAVIAGIGWFKIAEVEELKESLEKQIWRNLTLSTACRKAQARCDDLTIVVESLEVEVVELKGKVKS